MARKPAKIASQRRESGVKKACPECEGDMEMTRVMRSDGPSGMFWVCTDYKCATTLTKAGVRLDALELR
jgi:ssDNA-binding Zn-finger/Zn-ribbon topoisomerase 1